MRLPGATIHPRARQHLALGRPPMRWRLKAQSTPSSARHLPGRPPSPQRQHEIENAEQCTICQDASQPIVTTACGHFFHEACIGRWMRECGSSGSTSFACPVCRSLLTQTLTLAAEATNSEVERMALPNVSDLDLYLRRANAEPEPARAIRPRAHSFDVRSLTPNVHEWQWQRRARSRSLSDVSLPPRAPGRHVLPVRRFSNRPFDSRKEVQYSVADPLDWISRTLGKILPFGSGGTRDRTEQPRRQPGDELFGHHRLAFLSTWFDVSDSDSQSDRSSQWQSDWQSDSSSAREDARSRTQAHAIEQKA